MGIVVRAIANTNGWTILLTLLVMLVAYDQCQSPIWKHGYRSNGDLINRETVKYIWNKGSLVGPRMKIPFMGPFLESVYPKFESYQAKWASGELSCVSVFHKSVVLGGGDPALALMLSLNLTGGIIQVRGHCVDEGHGPKGTQFPPVRQTVRGGRGPKTASTDQLGFLGWPGPRRLP